MLNMALEEQPFEEEVGPARLKKSATRKSLEDI